MNRIEAYFDESGTHRGSQLLCLAGYIFKSDMAEEFSNKWNDLLSSYGLTTFHMVDCAHGNEEFKNITIDDRIYIEKSAIFLIKKYALLGIAVVMQPERFELIVPYHPRIGDAYSFVAHHCLDGVSQWISANKYVGEVAYFFEAGHSSQSLTDRLFKENLCRGNEGWNRGYVGHAFIEKQNAAMIQAADLLAWQVYKDTNNNIGFKDRRKDFIELISNVGQHRIGWIDDIWLLNTVHHFIREKAWGELQFDGDLS